MEIKETDYNLSYDKESSTAILKGSLRLLNLAEYEKVKVFFNMAAREANKTLTLDLKELIFLNSSGITTLSTFVISLRKENKKLLRIIGSKDIAWQDKSLKNLKKIWNQVELEYY